MKIIYTRPDGGTSVITLAAKSSVPQAKGMTDAEFVEWVKTKDVPEGSTNVAIIEDHEVPADPPQIPSRITIRQAKLALLKSGYLSDVEAFIASMPGADGDAARIEWATAAIVLRSHPLVTVISEFLSLTTQQLDDLFTTGYSL